MIKATIVGYGNIGRAAVEAVQAAEDFQLVGLVRRGASRQGLSADLAGVPVAADVKELPEKPQVAILCTPTRAVPQYAKEYLAQGINTVDSYDIHTGIWDLVEELTPVAQAGGAAAVVSAGWDPGSDSVVRALLQGLAPKGITYTNFGPGMSMGHTVAVKAIPGVENALSMTIPTGTGVHRRMVYVQLKEGADFAAVKAAVLADPYFVHDETHVAQVEDVKALIDTGYGVNLVRKGVSGTTHNQNFEFNMSINNPALTAQVLVCAARAACKRAPGAYTMIDLPVIDLLPGDRGSLIRALV